MQIRRRKPYWIVRVKKLIHKKAVRDWCKFPYHGHPKGCPNYGKKEQCPPQSKYITDIINVNKPIFMVFSEFDLGKHMSKMKKKHPQWSEHQLRNVLYWQSTSRKQMKERAKKAQSILGTEVIIYMAESNGVNIYATAFHAGLKLEKIKTLKINRHIAFIGYR